MAGTDDSPKIKKKLPFCYKLLKPNEEDVVEFQFEELRAVQYFAMYKLKSAKENQMENEITRLKQKVADMQEQLEVDHQNKETNSNKKLINDHELLNSKTKPRNKSASIIKATNDYSRATINDQNFTNVTQMTTGTRTRYHDETEGDESLWQSNVSKQVYDNNSTMCATNTLPTIRVKMKK